MQTPYLLEHVYMRPEVNSNRFEILFRLHGNLHKDFTAQLYFAVGIYCFHGKLTVVRNFTSVNLIEVKFAPK